MQYIIEVSNLNKRYHVNNNEIVALSNVNLKFSIGKMYAIMGHSGSGKSTLIHVLGLLDSTDGNIYIDNKDISLFTEEQKANFRRDDIGFVFQSYYLNPLLKAYENVIQPMYINKKIKAEQRKEKAYKLLEEVGLEDRKEHYPRQLSGGEQQRVAIARALANDPRIILADEPTGNLDEQSEIIILEKLKKLTEKDKCVIVVSHNEIIKKYADEVYYMKQGKIFHENK